VNFTLVLGGDVIDHLQVACLGALFQHRRPGRTLQLNLVIPLGIVERIRNRLLAFQLVPALAHVLVRKQLGRQHPDFLSVVARTFDLDFVCHFHHVHVLANLLDGLVTGARGLVEIEFLEFPEVAVVVTIDRGLQIGARIEAEFFLAESMRELHADFPRGVVVIELVLCSSEQHAAFGDPRIGVGIAVVQQRARQPVEVIACGFIQLGRGRVQLAPHLLEARKAADRQRFDARILDHADHRHLHRVERLG